MGTQSPDKDSLPGGGSTLVSTAAWGQTEDYRDRDCRKLGSTGDIVHPAWESEMSAAVAV